jgi:outer membrane lipoprotein carrier protein
MFQTAKSYGLSACMSLSIALLFACSFAWAEEIADPFACRENSREVDTDKLLSDVEKGYKTFSGLEAKFDQTSLFLGLNKEVQSSGAVSFKKPGMMDWNYLSPDPQRFVSDGETLWFYQPDVNQVTMGNFTASFDSDLPVSFLLGVGEIRDSFAVASSCVSDAGYVLNLTPKKPDPNLNEFYLLVDSDKKVPIGARIIDVGGNETSIVFKELQLTSKLEDSAFVFSIPRGVDILDRRTNKGL